MQQRIDIERTADVTSTKLWLLRLTGYPCLGLGAVGLVLPLMPTTIFWILAAIAFERGAPEWAQWLRGHPAFGRPIRDFLDAGVMNPRAKIGAYAGLSLGVASAWIALGGGAAFAVTGAILGGVAVWIALRPTRRPDA